MSIERENGINFGQLLARKKVAIVAHSAKQVLKKARLRCGAERAEASALSGGTAPHAVGRLG